MNKDDIKKILLVKNDRIGDMIISSSVIRELKKEFPDAKIDIIASKVNKPLIEKNEGLSRIYILGFSPRRLSEFCEYYKLSRKLKKEKYDLGIELRGGLFNIFFFLWLSGIKNRIGFYHQEIGKYLLNFPMKKEKEKIHSTKLRLKLLNDSLGLNLTDYWPDLWTDEKDKENVQNIMKEHGLFENNFICIVPDATAEKKAVPIEEFDKLIKMIKGKYPKKEIVLLGTDYEKINYLKSKNPNCKSILNENLRSVYLLFQKSELVIAHDGGAMHLSWSGKSPTLGIIEQKLNYKYIYPLGEKSHYIVCDTKKIEAKDIFDKIEKILDNAI